LKNLTVFMTANAGFTCARIERTERSDLIKTLYTALNVKITPDPLRQVQTNVIL